jgi:hypothetical protein
MAALLVGGYVLGRTKKARAAVRLAMWIQSNRGPISHTVGNVAKNDDIAKLVGQVQGPLLEAVQKAAIAAATARLEQITGTLADKTSNLTDVANKSIESVTDTATDTTDKATDAVGDVTDTATGVIDKVGGKSKSEDDESEKTEDKPKSEDKPKENKPKEDKPAKSESTEETEK